MSILARTLLRGIKALSMEDPSQPLLPASALFESLGLGRSDAGNLINEKQAMRLSTAYACIKVISEDLSRLSLDIFQTLPDGSLRVAREHNLYSLLHDRPNENMSSMVWRGAQLAALCAWGNAYSWIKRDGAARVKALVPLDSGKTSPVKVRRKDGGPSILMYATTQTDTGEAALIDPQNVLHFMGLSLDGVTGMSPIQTCKNVFGLGLAAESFGAKFFGQGARATGVFTHPESLEPEAYENISKSVRERMTGEQALRPLILEEGMKWQQISIPPNDAQFLETRKFQKEEVAGLYRVPLHLLQDLQRATNNNIEHQGLDYVRFCLAPRAVNIEQEINYKLLGGSFTAEHNFMDLTRGDFASQTTGLLALRNGAVYCANDVLRALRQNPIPTEEGGDVRIVNSAMIPLSSLVDEEGKPVKPETAGTDPTEGNPAASAPRLASAYRPLFRDAVGRATKRASDPSFCRRAMKPIVQSIAEASFAMRLGITTLTDDDIAKIDSVVDSIVVGQREWEWGADLNDVAHRLACMACEAFAK